MKKLNLLFALLLIAAFTFAQRNVGQAVQVNMEKFNLNLNKEVTDTLMPPNWNNEGMTYYTVSNNGGFVAGINTYLDLAKAQEYTPTQTYNVEGGLMLFPVKGDNQTPGNNGSIDFNLWSFTDDSPDAILASHTIVYDDIDTTAFTVAMFDAPVTVNEHYAVGIDMTNCFENDTVILSVFSLITTTDGDAGQSALSWEMWSDGSWYTILEAWQGLDIDFAIFPVVDMTNEGISEMSFVDGIKLATYPNPATNFITFDYEIANAADVVINIVDAKGQRVMTLNEGLQGVGLHSAKADVSGLAEGNYFVAIEAGSSRIAKRVVITR